MKKAPKPKRTAAAKPGKATRRVTAKPVKARPRAAKEAAGGVKRVAKRTATGQPAGDKMFARRADFGAPIDGFFAKQPPHLRAVLEALRKLVEEAAPDATASIKWGMPFYSVGNAMMCALGGHKSHVNLILAGPPGAFADPEGRLEGAGKTGRHLAVRSIDELPRADVRGWLSTAVEIARAKG